MGAALWAGKLLGSRAAAQGVAQVDTHRYVLHADGRWVSAAWRDEFERVLARHDQLSVLERDGLEALRAELEALSFVAEVGALEVVWPDGLSVPLRLREPVACVRVHDVYFPVDSEGVVLAGARHGPHEAFGAWLPVIGPNDGALNHVRPGDVLVEARHLNALDVAVSMWNHLPARSFFDLGRVLIDASADFGPDGLPGGVRIDLEERRRFLLGRPPLAGEPGELPYATKWNNVTAGLARLRAGEDWDLFDARWDEPRPFRRSAIPVGEDD